MVTIAKKQSTLLGRTMPSDLVAIENRLWAAADQLWANTGLKPAEFSTPVLGLIFLRYADKRFGECDQALAANGIPADEREPMRL
jgi:type I restriction enzyme M protein